MTDQPETCEVCGAVEGVRPWGWDHTPLCPRHWQEAWQRLRDLEDAETLRQLAHDVPGLGSALPREPER